MNKLLINALTSFFSYIASGFGSTVGLCLLLALWQLGFESFGELVLSDPLATLLSIGEMLGGSQIQQALTLTLTRAGIGFLLAAVIGVFLGMLAGRVQTVALLLRPLATLLMGTPPIAWIVLAMIWFGLGNNSVIVTLVMAIVPVTFIGALQGMATLPLRFQELADGFRVPWHIRFSDIVFPHLFSYVFPSLVIALGMSWKIVVMAELLAASDGIGSWLAAANTQLDTQMALGLVIMMVSLLMGLEYLFLEPIKRKVERWRKLS